MSVAIDRINPAVAFVRALGPGWFMCTEVADVLGTSPATLRRIARDDPVHLGPAHVAAFGGTNIWLYDLTQIHHLHDHLSARGLTGRPRRGRPRLWTDEERRHRRIALSAASYQRRRARALRVRVDAAGAVIAEQSAADITAGLRAELLDREGLVARAGQSSHAWFR